MLKFNFIKTLTAGVALATAFYPQAWAVIKTGSACSDRCTYYYNTDTYELNIEKKATVSDETEVILSSVNGIIGNGGTLSNVTIGEGIVGMKSFAFSNLRTTVGSTITFPSTFKTDSGGLFGTMFDNIDVSAVSNTTITLSAHNNSEGTYNPNIIMKSDSDITFVVNRGSGVNISAYDTRYEYNIICRGDKDDCKNQVRNGYHGGQTLNDISYYTGLNEDGNWEVWSDEGKAVYADSTLQKLLSKYDFDGTQTGVYKYDGAGNLTAAFENGVSTYKRTSYTPAEAAKAVKKGNNNKVTLTFK